MFWKIDIDVYLIQMYRLITLLNWVVQSSGYKAKRTRALFRALLAACFSATVIALVATVEGIA